MLSVREAWNASRRAPLLSILGVVTIAFSLFAFGLFALVAVMRSAESRRESKFAHSWPMVLQQMPLRQQWQTSPHFRKLRRSTT